MARSKTSAAKQQTKETANSVLEFKPKSTGAIAENIRNIIQEVGEDPDRSGLLDTPLRSEKAFKYLTSGYTADIGKIVNNALFDVEYDEIVIVRDIEFYSMCEHHLLPFFGKMHIAYLPGSKVIGLSKIPRIVDVFARRFQIQERLTQQVADTLQEILQPRGVAVICEARHFCMMMRGVGKQHSGAITSTMIGAFREDKQTRHELLSLVGQRSTAI